MLPEKSFENRVGIITGGGTGIGFGIARELARLGATVILASRKEEHLRPAVEQIRAAGGRAEFHLVDVREAESVEAMAAKVGPVDFLVNNAAGNFVVQSEQLSVNGWNSVVGIVLNGTFYCTSAVGKRMIESGRGGVILNVIANYAWTGAPGVVHSASAKAEPQTAFVDVEERRVVRRGLLRRLIFRPRAEPEEKSRHLLLIERKILRTERRVDHLHIRRQTAKRRRHLLGQRGIVEGHRI